MDRTIILIGPMGVGKTTIAARLADKLDRKWIELDDIRWDYYREAGYDDAAARQVYEAGGQPAIIAYWKPFEAHSVERVLQDHRECVISFGAGHSVYEDEQLFARVKAALQPYRNVILLLPSPDVTESLRILRQRIPAEVPAEAIDDYMTLNAHFIQHPSNTQLAKRMVYTLDKTPDETCDEIIGKLE